jgi:F0F1-type ATP synthase assembly protein I
MNSKGSTNNSWWQPGLLLFFRLSGWIGVPVLIGVVVGKWLDRKYGTEPWLFILSVGASFILSMFGMIKEAMKAMKEIDKNEKKSEIPNPKSETNSKSK